MRANVKVKNTVRDAAPTKSMDRLGLRVVRAWDALCGRALMACPHCTEDMVPRRHEAELHWDPTGYGVYVCENPECGIKPRYRRVDIESADPGADKMLDKLRQDHLNAYYRMCEEKSRITSWLRDNGLLGAGSTEGWADAVVRLLRQARKALEKANP